MWEKGQSGNPGGRPKEVAEIKALARQHTKAAINTLVAIMKAEDATHAARVAAATALLDRGYGKPASVLEGADGGAARLVVEYIDPTRGPLLDGEATEVKGPELGEVKRLAAGEEQPKPLVVAAK
jgi:hypothetical protein